MSRVIANTLRSAAAGGLVFTSLVFAACGGDDSANTAADSASGTTDTAIAVAEATPQPKDKAKVSAPAAEPDTSGAPAVFKTDAAVTKEGTKAIKAASADPIPAPQLSAQVDRVKKALEAEGFKITLEPGSDDAPTVLRSSDRINVSIFSSDQGAARQAASVLVLLDQSKLPARVAREDNVVVTLLGKARGVKFKSSDLARFDSARESVKPV